MGAVSATGHLERAVDVVRTAHGAVPDFTADAVHVCVMVPYAAPPFGERRPPPPQPVKGWRTLEIAGLTFDVPCETRKAFP